MNRTTLPVFNLYLTLFFFAVAMGFLEAIVVVYLRELYYPHGFDFPLSPMNTRILETEIIREISTLIMLVTVSFVAGKTIIRRLSAFLFLFGVWDIFYYIALWLFLDWPESLLTWDILFLIPITWTGPVLAPVLCSVAMIALAVLLERQHKIFGITSPGRKTLLFMIAGSAFIITAFIYDFTVIILQGNYLSQLATLAENERFLQELTTYIPERFQWEIFLLGFVSIGIGTWTLLKKRK